jgi:hypothetical protein
MMAIVEVLLYPKAFCLAKSISGTRYYFAPSGLADLLIVLDTGLHPVLGYYAPSELNALKMCA